MATKFLNPTFILAACCMPYCLNTILHSIAGCHVDSHQFPLFFTLIACLVPKFNCCCYFYEHCSMCLHNIIFTGRKINWKKNSTTASAACSLTYMIMETTKVTSQVNKEKVEESKKRCVKHREIFHDASSVFFYITSFLLHFLIIYPLMACLVWSEHLENIRRKILTWKNSHALMKAVSLNHNISRSTLPWLTWHELQYFLSWTIDTGKNYTSSTESWKPLKFQSQR